MSLQAYCMICTDPIYAAKTDDINMLYEDDLNIPVGRPICVHCLAIVRSWKLSNIEPYINYLKKYYAKKNRKRINQKIGLERWI